MNRKVGNLSSGLLEEHELANLLVRATTSPFHQDVEPAIGIEDLHLQALPAGAASVERVDAVVARPTGDVVIPTDECFRAAADHLLIQKPESVVALVADAVGEKWSALEFSKRRRYDVLQR